MKYELKVLLESKLESHNQVSSNKYKVSFMRARPKLKCKLRLYLLNYEY